MGFIVDDTISHIGHDFYYSFSERLRATSPMDFNLVVRERPSAPLGQPGDRGVSATPGLSALPAAEHRGIEGRGLSQAADRGSTCRSSSASWKPCCRTPPTLRGTNYEHTTSGSARHCGLLGLWFAGAGSAGLVQATELVYTPVNPAFGGNLLNGTWLLNNAQAQNDYDDPDLKNRTRCGRHLGPGALHQSVAIAAARAVAGQHLHGQHRSLSTDAFVVNVIDDSGALTYQSD